MFRKLNVSASRLLSAPKYLPKVRPFSTIKSVKTEVIGYNDPFWFPPETGPIQRSIFADQVVLPRCRIDQYIWTNSGSWQDKTAVVGIFFSRAKYAECNLITDYLQGVRHHWQKLYLCKTARQVSCVCGELAKVWPRQRRCGWIVHAKLSRIYGGCLGHL